MDDKKLEEMYQATMENNRMLKGMRRSAFVGGIVKAVWWVLLLIVLPYLTWLYIQPYLETIMNQYQDIQGQGAAYNAQAEQFRTMFDANGYDWKALYEQYFGSAPKQ